LHKYEILKTKIKINSPPKGDHASFIIGDGHYVCLGHRPIFDQTIIIVHKNLDIRDFD